MTVLLDSNILLRITETSSSRHSDAVQATRLLGQSEQLVTVPQVSYEFWAVATRTVEANGLGMSAKDATKSLEEFMKVFRILKDERGIFSHWWDLVQKHEIHGVPSHDTRLVAAMQRHDIKRLLTFNVADFNRYDEISVLTPELVLANS